ncbi:pre-mRNA-splicing factor CWC22 homolog isoform X3 [Prunus dulcis]|uniref:pre-mRNA-splicing factor CWC22 homolog isoform X3 n=1 Tax=Prunus dulcis TaxID=3755 RepID=UPI00148200A4|nr:pre-mRNA-splicing factor CWC22 homolog isoform X3 [Prunus dulcis]
MENMDDSTLARESDLNFAVDNVEKAYRYADEKSFERRDCFNEDVIQHEQQSPPSIHADVDFKYEISESLPEKSCPVPTESDQDSAIETKFAHERERTESPFKDNKHYQGEMDELHGSNFLNPSSQSKSQTFHIEMGTEDSAHSQESPLTERANQGVGEDDSNMGRPTAVPHAGRAKMIYSERSQYESVKSSIHEVEREASGQWKEQLLSSPKLHRWDNENKKDESPGQNNNPGISNSDIQSLGRIARGSISPRIKRQMSLSPEDSPSSCHFPNNHEHLPSHQGSQDQSLAPRSHSQHISSLDHYLPPTQGIRQFSHHRDSSALKHISASPRSHGSPPRSHASPPRSYHSPPRSYHSPRRSRRSPPRSHRSPPRSHRSQSNHGRRDRLESRSPIRHRDSYGYQRAYRERSRSRSPYSRAHHRPTRILYIEWYKVLKLNGYGA